MTAGCHFDLLKSVAFFVGFILEHFGFGFFTDDVNKNKHTKILNKSIQKSKMAAKVICQAINYINPGQTPVMEVDQPLFTLAKKLQWKNPGTEFDEESFLVTLGAMHTEKMLWGVSGDWLDGSGWVTALTNSGIASSGKAQSFIGVHHICRTRYMHQVTVAAI